MFALFLIALPSAFASTLIYNESFEGTGLPNGWEVTVGTTNWDNTTAGYESPQSVSYNADSTNTIPSSVFDKAIVRNYSIMLNLSHYGYGGTAIFNIQENCRIGFGTTGFLEHFGAGSMGSNTSFAIPLGQWVVMQVELNATVCGAYLINASNGSVIVKLGPTGIADDQINARGMRGGKGFLMDNFSILAGSWDSFPAGVAEDTTPPEITFYNMTSEGGLGCTNWNTDKQNSCKTSDKTPTVKINLSEPSYCAISTLNLNYTDMIANDPLTNCTNAPGSILTCTLPDTKAFTSPGLFNISIGCKDETGNQNRSSTSGNLTINITDATPPTVTLEKPDNNAILFFKDRPFRFNFTATDDFGLLNMSCRLYFNNTLNQTNSSVKNGTLTNWALINLSRNVWQWNVTCTDNSSNTGSSARIVTINNSKPTDPALQTPSNNSGFGNQPSNLPEFIWNNSVDDDSDAIIYTIEVNNQSSFDGNRVYFNNSVPQDSDGVSGVNVTLPATDEDAYFWRVRGNDGIENSSFSQTFQFAYANWSITFNLTSSDTGKQINTPGPTRAFDISCNGFTATGVDNPHTATNGLSSGVHNCTFTSIEDENDDTYRDRTINFTANKDETIEVVVSITGGLTEEEHQWLEFLYTCFNSGECIDLLRTINQTTKDIWRRVTGTDTSVIIFENITTNTLSSSSNISIDYTIDIPVKEGYAVGALLPLRMFFWITDVNKTRCFNQDKATDTNRAEAPYCLPLVAETLGPNGGQVNFTVDLRPNVPNGDYNITRSIEIDPIIDNAVRWVNHGQDNIGQIKVIESGNADLYLTKIAESVPVRTPVAQATTEITGAITSIFQLTTQFMTIIISIVIILFLIIIVLLVYIIRIKKKEE